MSGDGGGSSVVNLSELSFPQLDQLRTQVQQVKLMSTCSGTASHLQTNNKYMYDASMH